MHSETQFGQNKYEVDSLHHQIFQLFGQHTGAWDAVLGEIFLNLIYFNTASGSEPPSFTAIAASV